MDNTGIDGRWDQIKGEIQNTWGKITGEELDRVKGNAKAIAGLIKEKYGDMKEDAKEKFDRIFHGAERTVAGKMEQVKDGMKNNMKNNDERTH